MRISKADVEFYQAAMVMQAAKALASKPWDGLSYRSKQRLLDKAVSVVHSILNHDDCLHRMALFAKQHSPSCQQAEGERRVTMRGQGSPT